MPFSYYFLVFNGKEFLLISLFRRGVDELLKKFK